MTRGVVFSEAGAPPAVEEITLDAPTGHEVLVHVQACGLCHSDVHVLETGGWGMTLPILLGHEGAGVVEEVGPEVTMVAPGDYVVVAWRAPCGRCPSCSRGDPRRCSRNLHAKPRAHRLDGTLLTPMLRCGTLADHAIVHEACAVKIPEALPVEQAALLACGFSTGAGAALWTSPVHEGATVAVIGCGGVGLAVVQGAKLAGAARIVAVDVAVEKLDAARALGATDLVDATAGDPVEQVRDLTTRGVDYAFSAIGAPAGLTQAVRMCAYAGWATLVGIPPYGGSLDVDLYRDVFSPKVGVAVTHGGDTIPQEDFPFLAQAALDGKIDLARFVTATIPLEEAPAALDVVGRDGIRTVVKF